MDTIDDKIQEWRKKLLDLTRKNRLLNYKITKRGSLKLTQPSFSVLYNDLVVDEKSLVFCYPLRELGTSVDGVRRTYVAGETGDIKTNIEYEEQQKTLKSLQGKMKTTRSEQGVNTLYVAFGFLKWTEAEFSQDTLLSPLVLVPVTIVREALSDPYTLELHDDEIVVNPTLKHKIENDFGIIFPDFDSDNEDIGSYIDSLKDSIVDLGWSIIEESHLTLLSFYKIAMYQDLITNCSLANSHFLTRALAGKVDINDSCLVETVSENFDHDSQERPIKTFHVLDADASQQDAISSAKKGSSFVLQGPPGTGKSQTIVNIIAESLAEGKKVLFVSEKAAALEVVKKRLASVGLETFCLAIHSDKVKKREVLDNLDNTWRSCTPNTSQNDNDSLLEIENERNSLNKYVQQLHTKIFPLEKSIYDVNGILATYASFPDADFYIENIRNIDSEKLSEILFSLKSFSHAYQNIEGTYTNNPWKGYIESTSLSHEKRQYIEKNLGLLIPALQELHSSIVSDYDNLNLSYDLIISEIDEEVNFLNFCSNASDIPNNWLEDFDFDEVFETINKYRALLDKSNTLAEELSQILNWPLQQDLLIQEKDSLDSLVANAGRLLQFISGGNQEYSTSSDVLNLKNEAKNLVDLFSRVLDVSADLASHCDIPQVIGSKELEILEACAYCIQGGVKPGDDWVTPRGTSERDSAYQGLSQLLGTIVAKENEISILFNDSVRNIDYQSIWNRYKSQYQNLSGLKKLFNKQYKQDVDALLPCQLYSDKKNPDKHFAALEILIELEKTRIVLEEFNSKYASCLGGNYKGEITDLAGLKKNIEDYDKLAFLCKGYLPHKMLEAIDNVELKFLANQQIYICSQFRNVYENHQFSQLIGSSKFYVENIGALKIALENFISTISEMETSLANVNMLCKKNIALPEAIKLLSDTALYFSAIEQSEKYAKSLGFNLSYFFNHEDTQWDEVISALLWASSFKVKINERRLSNEFTKQIIGCEKSRELCRNISKSITYYWDSVRPIFVWFDNLFEVTASSLSIIQLIEKATLCCNNLSSLESLLDVRVAQKRCEEFGIGEFIDDVLLRGIPATKTIPMFEKRFYKLWLDVVIPEYSAVAEFRTALHESRINEFKELDKKQFKIAAKRIQNILISKYPSYTHTGLDYGEARILKSEIMKKRRNMPLRKLFRNIPSLLLALKPCLMMSPLSVSTYLQSNDYKFDLVIFDEASQVFTEDAVCSIMRGKQIIIAGDSKQLPPTSFFSSVVDEDDTGDDDEDFDLTAGCDSVLEQAAIVIPPVSLRWHYRSRSEDLIAFSNTKIYNNSLYTFPASVDSNFRGNRSFGVELVYVPDGIYDRSHSGRNMKEAEKVRQIVFEHFKNYPDRSLGVVTLNTKQQRAVEDVIDDYRREHQEFEMLFSEEREEPFFVKNLESVQGDERDTIILCIGFGKDAQGKMSLNFGPINQASGYRRLNVAITRAKFNLKLVTSILTTDIKLGDNPNEGVALLNSYIDFAQNGVGVLQKDITYNNNAVTESPFEDSVYNYLINKGYSVVTQVGCSGYRVDLAVRHPELSNRFAIGIECDGASYHSARTARERDRLRQSILENMGWKIYRVWSTDWIKSPIYEGEKLVAAVEDAIKNCSKIDLLKQRPLPNKTSNEASLRIETFEVSEDDLPSAENPFGFPIYRAIDIKTMKDNGAYYITPQIITQVVSVEGPIHFAVLCQRLAPLTGRQKTTSVVRDEVSRRVRQAQNVSIRGDFVWPKEMTKVTPRFPSEAYRREAQHIAPEEIAAGMIIILKKSFGPSKDELLDATKRAFGYQHKGDKVAASLNNAFTLLLEKKIITISEDRIVFTNDANKILQIPTNERNTKTS